MTSNFSSTVAGLPRIGAKRELKFALEGYWNGSIEGRELAQTARQLVNTASDSLSGLDSVPFAGRSYYDAMLDTAAILGVLPERFDDIADHENDGLPLWIDRYFGAARGTESLPSRGPSGLRKTRLTDNSLAHITTWLSSQLLLRVVLMLLVPRELL